jgi:pimeloyl-ACP methyl ester carboxylesterase
MTRRVVALVTCLLLASGSTHAAESSRADIIPIPAFECEARVHYDRETTLPGYLLPTSSGPETCIPFTSAAERPPAGYKGDYYVDEFTDAKLRERWLACKKDPACFARARKPVDARKPPNKEYKTTDARARFLLGKVDEAPEIDLTQVRRPVYFERTPYLEPIAEAEQRTYTVEFTAPAEPHERIHKGITNDVKVRGWYIQGNGIDDGRNKRRALIMMTAGGGGRIAAIDDPADKLYHYDEKTGRTMLNDFPNATTGATGQRLWRQTAYRFNQAGFDVLVYDRRGVGISSGFSDTNTLQQGRDILAMIAALRDGKGLRTLTPSGQTRKGVEAVAAVRGGAPKDMPVLLFGNSRGTMASGWAMTMNFDKACTYDLAEITCTPPAKDTSIKGAILLSEFSSGVGYRPAKPSPEDEARGLGSDRGLFIAGNALEHNLVFFPSSAILAGVGKWPAAFFARGLWDYAAGLEGTVESYRRIKGLKELVIIRAPHPYETWPEPEKIRVMDRMIVFAQAAALGKKSAPGGRTWLNMKDLVGTTGDFWEVSSKPKGGQ